MSWIFYIAITTGRGASQHQPDKHEFGEYIQALQMVSALRPELLMMQWSSVIVSSLL